MRTHSFLFKNKTRLLIKLEMVKLSTLLLFAGCQVNQTPHRSLIVPYLPKEDNKRMFPRITTDHPRASEVEIFKIKSTETKAKEKN